MASKIQRVLGLLLISTLLAVSNRAIPAAALPGTENEAALVLAGEVHYATSCSQEDVQDAVDAASDGDLVLVPAGHCTWTTPLAATPAVEINGKGITIQGAGIGQTVITDATGAAWRQTPFWIEGLEGHPFRITGFTFTGQPSAQGVVYIGGTCKDFRIDHCRFENLNGRSIMVDGQTYGVIDHCDFWQLGGQGVWVADARGDPSGSTSWEEEMTYGTAEAVFIEDSTFIWQSGADSALDCTRGGRAVFRHNVVQGVTVGNHGLDSTTRSCLQMEIYDNTFLPASHGAFLAIQSRGGSAVVFNNTISDPGGAYNIPIGVTNYRSCCYAGAPCSSHGQCDGTNPIDGNQDETGWPCKDQIGRGTQQGSYPFYEWNNTRNGADVDVVVYYTWPACVDPNPTTHVQEGRDYFNDTEKPGYTPYVYPHPLTWELDLQGTPDNRAIHLDWTVHAYLPPTSTWQIDYEGTPGDEPSPVTGIVSPTHTYILTGMTNYETYTVTLSAMVDSTAFLSDTVHVMPTDIFVHLPLVIRSY